MPLDIRDLRLIRRTLRTRITKLEKAATKSSFVPQPGHTDVTVATLNWAHDVLARIEAASDE